MKRELTIFTNADVRVLPKQPYGQSVFIGPKGPSTFAADLKATLEAEPEDEWEDEDEEEWDEPVFVATPAPTLTKPEFLARMRQLLRG